MKKIFVKINERIEEIGYIEKINYDNEIFYKVVRKGMFDEIYNENELKDFIKNSNFIIK